MDLAFDVKIGYNNLHNRTDGIAETLSAVESRQNRINSDMIKQIDLIREMRMKVNELLGRQDDMSRGSIGPKIQWEDVGRYEYTPPAVKTTSYTTSGDSSAPDVTTTHTSKSYSAGDSDYSVSTTVTTTTKVSRSDDRGDTEVVRTTRKTRVVSSDDDESSAPVRAARPIVREPEPVPEPDPEEVSSKKLEFLIVVDFPSKNSILRTIA